METVLTIFARFDWKIKKKIKASLKCYETLHICFMFFFIDVSANNQLKI